MSLNIPKLFRSFSSTVVGAEQGAEGLIKKTVKSGQNAVKATGKAVLDTGKALTHTGGKKKPAKKAGKKPVKKAGKKKPAKKH